MTRIHVAVGVIQAEDDRILIAHRADHQHQGGLWEFPGGKLEDGETVLSALRRELAEELAIEVGGQPQPLCTVRHDYGDREVLLDVWLVKQFSGQPRGLQAQPLRWVPAAALKAVDFPAANRPIIRCLQLRDLMLISPAAAQQLPDSLQAWQQKQDALLQLRLPGVELDRYRALAIDCLQRLPQPQRLLLNTDPALATALHEQYGAGGCHLNRHRLRQYQQRPVPDSMLLGASCHDAQELQLAQAMGCDYALLSPVAATPSHPGADTLGWPGFAALSKATSLPVYALGGMHWQDLDTARQHGARGIAGIRLGATTNEASSG